MRIVFTTDGSEESWKAFPHATRLATAVSSRLVAVRVLDRRLDLARELNTSLSAAMKAVAGRWQEEMEARIAASSTAAEVAVVVKGRSESLAEALSAFARKERAAAVVMSSRGLGVVRHALLGSLPLTMVAEAGLPIMLAGVPASERPADAPYRVVVTTDGSPASASVWKPLRRLVRRASPGAVEVTVVAVHTGTGDQATAAAVNAEWAARQFARGAPEGLSLGYRVAAAEGSGAVAGAIIEAAHAASADAIWMATQGHSLRRHVLLGSVAAEVVAKSDVPVALVRAGAPSR